MRFPNKVTNYQESLIAKFPIVLSALKNKDLSASDLYKKVKNKIEDIGEYVEILDCLYSLGKIELISNEEVIHYVG